MSQAIWTSPALSAATRAAGSMMGTVDHPVHVGLLAPVVFVPLHHRALAPHPLHELERAGADRVLPDGLVAVLPDGGGADHVVVGKAGDGFDEPHVGPCQLHLEGVLVHHPRALEAPQHAGRGAADLLVVVRRLLVRHSLEVEVGGLGIERAAVVERHSLAKVEGVRGAVLGHAPALGETRHDRVKRLVRRPVLLHEPVVERHQGIVLGAADVLLDVEVRGVVGGRHHQRSAGARLAECGGGAEKGEETEYCAQYRAVIGHADSPLGCQGHFPCSRAPEWKSNRTRGVSRVLASSKNRKNSIRYMERRCASKSTVLPGIGARSILRSGMSAVQWRLDSCARGATTAPARRQGPGPP